MKIHQGILTRYNRLKDRSVNVSFNLNEMDSESLMEIDSLVDSFGCIYFKENGFISNEEQKAIDEADLSNDGKSQSERLRNVLFILYKQKNETSSFDEFYKRTTEKIIQHFKQKLK